MDRIRDKCKCWKHPTSSPVSSAGGMAGTEGKEGAPALGTKTRTGRDRSGQGRVKTCNLTQARPLLLSILPTTSGRCKSYVVGVKQRVIEDRIYHLIEVEILRIKIRPDTPHVTNTHPHPPECG